MAAHVRVSARGWSALRCHPGRTLGSTCQGLCQGMECPPVPPGPYTWQHMSGSLPGDGVPAGATRAVHLAAHVRVSARVMECLPVPPGPYRWQHMLGSLAGDGVPSGATRAVHLAAHVRVSARGWSARRCHPGRTLGSTCQGLCRGWSTLRCHPGRTLGSTCQGLCRGWSALRCHPGRTLGSTCQGLCQGMECPPVPPGPYTWQHMSGSLPGDGVPAGATRAAHGAAHVRVSARGWSAVRCHPGRTDGSTCQGLCQGMECRPVPPGPYRWQHMSGSLPGDGVPLPYLAVAFTDSSDMVRSQLLVVAVSQRRSP
ncbi:hypothetical protein NDU88_000169 [Pleurodeles waltl]|uniref:Uncharacterized protein n=1 Tax=Pleurodeles waltl TaxID=8319 RepID=A0AAV7LXF2_PLEWA|nr:hypothetical protein NDU88_000169 [Pleurodeles waltl]